MLSGFFVDKFCFLLLLDVFVLNLTAEGFQKGCFTKQTSVIYLKNPWGTFFSSNFKYSTKTETWPQHYNLMFRCFFSATKQFFQKKWSCWGCCWPLHWSGVIKKNSRSSIFLFNVPVCFMDIRWYKVCTTVYAWTWSWYWLRTARTFFFFWQCFLILYTKTCTIIYLERYITLERYI